MGHIKGSLGHGGWYLTQIHIFHSDGRGTMEGSGRVRACIYVYVNVCVFSTWGWSACSKHAEGWMGGWMDGAARAGWIRG